MTEFHKRKTINSVSYTLQSLNFAKRCCADDANLCEVVEINAGEKNAQFEGVLDILKANNFDTQYRRQLESMAASGTVGGYIRLEQADILKSGLIRGGKIRLNYVDAEGIVPLTVINNEVVECAFTGTDLAAGKEVDVLVIFVLEKGKYVANTYYFEDNKNVPERDMSLQLGEIKPFFIMRTAEVNNLDDMAGYGYPKLYSTIPVLEMTDLAYNILFSDLDKGEKIILVNELLCKFDRTTGEPTFTPEQKKYFIQYGEEKHSDDKSLVHEYNPEIRIDAITKTLETCFSLLSMSFGYGTKRYSFENGQIKTATEYIGERQDAMQELNKQRYEATQYITAICRAIMWFSNTFHETAWNLESAICIQFDDSYITDKQTELETMRADAISFPQVQEFLVQYVMMRLNCEREEALKYIQNTEEPVDDLED